jgi:threonine dehydratase
MATVDTAVTPDRIAAAAAAIGPTVRQTPLLPAGELSRRAGGRVLLKAESLQITGSFKLRGALNAIRALDEEQLAAGIVAASAGNHAQAVSFAARAAGTTARLVMPSSAPLAKIAAVRRYGGEVELIDGGYDEAGALAAAVAESEGRTLVHAFDDPAVVAGQGTAGLEIADAAPDTRLIVVPLGGGGLASGVAIAAKDRLPGVRVVGVQADAFAPYADPDGFPRRRGARTICDGIAVKRPGAVTGPLVERWIDEVVTVTDDDAAEAMVLLIERSKLVVEGAGAVGVAALLSGRVQAGEGDTCVVLSGGNVDASLLSECIRLGETAAGRRMVISLRLPDRPGTLAELVGLVAREGGNIVDVTHLREGVDLHIGETAVQLVIQTRGPEHGQELVAALREGGFDA